MRAVVDPNVIISSALSPRGSPARVMRAWLDGAFELVCSDLLLAELDRALSYPKLRKHIDADEARALIELLQGGADVVDDPAEPPTVRSSDSGDDYLIALAESERSVIVSGDGHLLVLADQLPVYSPTAFLALLAD